MPMSDYLENKILNHIFRGSASTAPDAVYVALYTNDPTDADVGTEVTGGAYARQTATFSAPTQVGGKATIQNTADVTFPLATANWGTVTHVGLRDAATGGNMLYYGPLANEKTISTNDRFKFFAGDLKLDID
ncbi:phage tail fiber protein [Aneurinibacillus sp. REN35]|uniref:phage tail fiber protein n=1 Tax=Aneurinibacillus sp. REN35 TaxID=3237286 RepID=UPI003527B4A5